MRPIDILFIILVFSPFLKDTKQKYFIVLLPLLAFTLSSFNASIPIPIEPIILPVLAIIAAVISLKQAPIALLLLLPNYHDIWDALMMPIFWLMITPLMDSLHNRLNADYMPAYLRGYPIRLISLGILYYIFYPLFLI